MDLFDEKQTQLALSKIRECESKPCIIDPPDIDFKTEFSPVLSTYRTCYNDLISRINAFATFIDSHVVMLCNRLGVSMLPDTIDAPIVRDGVLIWTSLRCSDYFISKEYFAAAFCDVSKCLNIFVWQLDGDVVTEMLRCVVFDHRWDGVIGNSESKWSIRRDKLITCNPESFINLDCLRAYWPVGCFVHETEPTKDDLSPLYDECNVGASVLSVNRSRIHVIDGLIIATGKFSGHKLIEGSIGFHTFDNSLESVWNVDFCTESEYHPEDPNSKFNPNEMWFIHLSEIMRLLPPVSAFRLLKKVHDKWKPQKALLVKAFWEFIGTRSICPEIELLMRMNIALVGSLVSGSVSHVQNPENFAMIWKIVSKWNDIKPDEKQHMRLIFDSFNVFDFTLEQLMTRNVAMFCPPDKLNYVMRKMLVSGKKHDRDEDVNDESAKVAKED